MFPGFIASSACTPKYPSTSPSTPPASESSTLSVSNCPTMRLRPAPSAARIAISRRRIVARASNKFATFAHAISSTQPTAPSNTSSDVRTSPTTVSLIGNAVKLLPCPPNAPGNFRSNSAAACFIAACAIARVTPGFSRAVAWK